MTARGAAPVSALFIAVVVLPGCAGRTVEVGYPETAANRALLGSIAARRVVVAPVGDHRVDKARIGVRPEDGEPIVTARPVTEIVRDALVTEVGKNGHAVVPGAGDVIVAADVEEFWLDAAGPSATTQYVARVAIAVVVADGRTSDRLMTRRYVGTRRRTAEADSKAAWREVMETALARTMHDVATDPELAMAVSRASR
jgi:hypothetical protein